MTLTSEKKDYGTLSVDDEVPKGCCARLYPSGFFPELKILIKLTVPMVLTQLFQYMIGIVALMFCGHLGEVELAAVALANSFISITGLTIALGLACACDTLFAQVYGSRNKKRLGLELQRSLAILLLAVFPCWAIHLNMEALLRLLGQDPFVSRMTAKYLIVFMPGVVFFFLYVVLSKYLQNQNIVIPNLIIGAISNLVNALLHYLLVIVAGLGPDGSAISQVLSYFTMMSLTFGYIMIMKVYKDTWDGWSWECLREWGVFFKLAAFGLVMLCVEHWSFEIGVITAGLMGTKYLGAMSVIFQLETFAYMLPLGTGIAASIRVGQFLGAGDAARAQTAARVTMTSICVAEVGVAIIFLTLREYLPMLFTDVPEVIELVQNVLYICAVYQISDGLAGTGAGILRGQGRQHLGAAIVFGGFAAALSAGTPLMLFTSLKLYAFWGGLAIALTVEGILFALIIHFNDWETQANQALLRAKVMLEEDTTPGEDKDKMPLLQCSGSVHDVRLYSGTWEQARHLQTQTDDKLVPLRDLVPRRVAAVVVVVSIFIGGILLRVFYTNNLELPAASSTVWPEPTNSSSTLYL